MEDALAFFASELDNIWDIDTISNNLVIFDNGRMAIYDSTYFKFKLGISANLYPPISDQNKVKYVTHLHARFPYVFHLIAKHIRRNRDDYIRPVIKVLIHLRFSDILLFTPTLNRIDNTSTMLTQREVAFANANLVMNAFDEIIQQLSSVESAVFTRSNKRMAYNDSRMYKFTSNSAAADDWTSIGFEIYFTDVVDVPIIHERVICFFRESLLQLVDDLQTHGMRELCSKYADTMPGQCALRRVAAQIINYDPRHLRCTIIIEDTDNQSFEFNPTLISSRTNISVPVASSMQRSFVTYDPYRIEYAGIPYLLTPRHYADPVFAATATYNNTYRQGPLVRIPITNQEQVQTAVPTVLSEDARLYSGAGRVRNKTRNKKKNKKNRKKNKSKSHRLFS